MALKWATLVAMVMSTMVTAQRRGTPPTIQVPGGNQWREKTIYIRIGNSKNFDCFADGNPTPTYMWMVEDGTRREMREVKYYKGVTYNNVTGKLTVTKDFTSESNANFTCVAINEHGKARTPPLTLEAASVTSGFPGLENSQSTTIRKAVTERLKLTCDNLKELISKPAFDISWENGTWNREKLETVKINLEDHNNVVIDPEGSLHFLWIEPHDFGYVYVCSASNSKMLSSYRNTVSYELKQITGNPIARDPSLVYSADVTAMAGTMAKLTCIFSYYTPDKSEELVITWVHHSGQIVGTGMTYEKLAVVPTATQNMSGVYMCEARLGDSTNTKKGFVTLTIISPPKIIVDASAQVALVGSDATFQCVPDSYQTYADPPVWYRNTIRIRPCSPPMNMVCPEKRPNGDLKCAEKCNGVPECNNEEDELGCGSRQCSEDMKLCKGVCVNSQAPCEQDSPCVYPFFECKDKSLCLAASKKCNNVADCPDGTDEEFCPGGQPLDVDGFIISSDRTTLTLPNVALTDQMCFQCSIANKHGTTWWDGCLTVIDRIRIVQGPNDTYNVEPGMYVNIAVDATTDRLYQIKYHWIMYNDTTDAEGNAVKEILKLEETPYKQYFRISHSGKNLSIIIPDIDEAQGTEQLKYDAYMFIADSTKYALVVSHPEDSVTVNFTVAGVEVAPPPPKPAVEQASMNLWFIALILAVLILFIVIALIVCYMYRNRGGTYPLDKKEHQAGHDPAQELKDNAFHDVGRVDDEYDDDKPRADEVSLSESVKPYESDEDITAEYGEDLDLSKFNEEGSFIFQYGDKKSRSKEATV